MMKRTLKNISLCFTLTMAVLLICPALVRSQESPDNIDSLKASLAKLPADSTSFNLIVQEASKFDGVNYTLFLEIINIAEMKAVAMKSPRWLGSAFYLKGCTYLQLADYVQATKYLTLSKIIAERYKNQKLFMVSVAELGRVYEFNGQLDQALAYYNQGLMVSNLHKDPLFKGMLLNKIAGIQYRKGEFDKSISTLKESIQLMKLAKDTFNSIKIINNVALLYQESGNLDSAEYYLGKSKQIMDPYRFRRPDILMSYYTVRGNLDIDKKEYKQALESYQLSLKFADEISSTNDVGVIYEKLSLVHEHLGNYKDALNYLKRCFILKDSVNSKENFAKALEIQNKYEVQKKENELLRIHTENEIKRVEIQRMSERKSELINYIILLISVIVLFIFLLIVLIMHTRSRRKAYHLLTEKNVQIESQSKELSQSAKLIAKFQFQMNPHFVFNALHNIQGLIIAQENSKATDQIQRLGTLMRKTFNNAEKDYITIEEEILYLNTYFSFETNTSFQKIKFSTEVPNGLEDALIPPMMIQPFIENSLKHAQLTGVADPFIKVSIANEDDFLRITIEDNGKGIKSSKDRYEGSHSMFIIQSRIELIFQGIFFPAEKKAFSVKTIPEIEFGTIVRFYLPLQYLY